MLPQSEVAAGIQQELLDFAALVRSLEDGEFARPSRCDGWTVGDVASHVIGSFADITSGRIEGQDTPEVTARQVAERRGRTAAELADELDHVTRRAVRMLASFDDEAWAAQAPGGYDLTLGQAMEAFWCGTYVHADDIRAAIGRPSERGPGLRASVHHVADLLGLKGWGPAVLALDGLDELRISAGHESAAPRITGDPLAFLLAATGRADPAPLGLDPTVNVYA